MEGAEGVGLEAWGWGVELAYLWVITCVKLRCWEGYCSLGVGRAGNGQSAINTSGNTTLAYSVRALPCVCVCVCGGG